MADPGGFFGVVTERASALEAALRRASAGRGHAIHRFAGEGWHAAVSGGFSGKSPGCIAWVGGQLFGDAASPAQAGLQAYERWNTVGFSRLGGNFWIAIFDPALRGFRVSTDVGGSKPLFHALSISKQSGTVLVFGSSAQEVLRGAALPSIVEAGALQRYLSSGMLAGYPGTLLQGVRALRRRRVLEIVPGSPWNVREVVLPDGGEPQGDAASFDDRAAELRELLVTTVGAQSRASSVAVALSGGIDSSGILAALRQARGRHEPLHAYSYVQRTPAPAESWNERPWAESAAAFTKATLHPVELLADELPGALRQTVAEQDFPFGSPVILAQAKLFRAAAENGTQTILSGHGPDILFGGGESQITWRLAQFMRKGRLVAAAKMLPGARAHAIASMPSLIASALRQAMNQPPRGRAESGGTAWTSSKWFAERLTHGRETFAAPHSRPAESMQALVRGQLDSSPGSTTLLYEECNAQARGLDNRLPYLTAEMVKLSRACSPEYLVSDAGQTKRILRRALSGLLPKEILERRGRVGFAVPVLPWLIEKRAWVENRYAELRSLPFFRGAPLHEMWAQLEGPAPAAWPAAFAFWRWVVLLEWVRARNVRIE